MRRAAATLAALLAVPAFARSWSGIEGDGKPTTQRREVPAFERIALDTATDVKVRVGGERSVTVTIDANLQRHLRTEVKGGVLHVDSDENLHPRGQARVEVTVPALRGFALAGSGDVAIEDGSGAIELAIGGSGNLRWKGEASDLRASIEGSGNLRLEGRADRLTVSVDGSGDVDAAGLHAKDVAASVSGSGNVDVNVDGGKLTGAVSGSGDIHYRGETKVESVTISGSGSVVRKE